MCKSKDYSLVTIDVSLYLHYLNNYYGPSVKPAGTGFYPIQY